MADEDIICLQAKPWLQSRFSFAHLDTKQALRKVYRSLRLHAAQPADVMTQFDPDLRWVVPARHSSSVDYCNLLPRINTALSVRELFQAFSEVLALVSTHGFQGPARKLLVSVVGRQALNPLVFTPTDPSMYAAKLFSVEFALAMYHRSGVMIVEGNNCYKRLKGTANIALPVGLYNRKSVTRVPDWLHKTLYEPRGYLAYDSFDTLDRCLLWSDKCLSGYEKQEFDIALLSIKAQKSANLTAQFDRVIRKMELPFEEEDHSFDIPFAELLYTEDALEQIKSIWNTSGLPDYPNYKELYEYLVPHYFSPKQFTTIFHVGSVLKSKFNYEHVETIDKRFDEFVAFFKRMMPRK